MNHARQPVRFRQGLTTLEQEVVLDNLRAVFPELNHMKHPNQLSIGDALLLAACLIGYAFYELFFDPNAGFPTSIQRPK